MLPLKIHVCARRFVADLAACANFQSVFCLAVSLFYLPLFHFLRVLHIKNFIELSGILRPFILSASLNRPFHFFMPFCIQSSLAPKANECDLNSRGGGTPVEALRTSACEAKATSAVFLYLRLC